MDLGFAGPRHGAASWLGAPAPAGGMDFIAPDATIALDLRLKDLSQVLDDVQSLVDPANRSFATSLETMQKQFNINLRDDLLSQLTGEVALAVDPPSGPGDTTPEVRAILKVRDADGLQHTLKQVFTLLSSTTPDANESVHQRTEGGVTYYFVRSPRQPKAIRLYYGFVACGSGSDVDTISTVVAIGVPHLFGSRTAANESAAAQTVRLITTYQITYATTYPDKGFARSLAVLGGGPPCPKSPSARHACLLDAPLGDAGCVAGAWCERDGFS